MVVEVVFDAVAQVEGELAGFVVAHAFGGDDDADFAAGLHGVGFGDAGEGAGEVFERADALEVAGDGFGAGAGAGGGEAVGNDEQRGVDAFGGDLLVVGGDGVDDAGVFPVGAEEVGGGEGVAAGVVAVEGFAEVVEEAGTAGGFGVEAEFGGDKGADGGDFDGVIEGVLVVGEAEVELAEEGDEFGVDGGEVEAGDGFFAEDGKVVADFVVGLEDEFLDAGGVDAAVGDEAFEGEAGDFAADGVEAGDEDGVGGFVDHEGDAGGGLEGLDVAAFAADDAAFHFLIGEADEGGADFGGDDGGEALEGVDEDAAAFVLQFGFGAVAEFVAEVAQLGGGLGADLLAEGGAELLLVEGGGGAEAFAVELGLALELVAEGFDFGVAAVEEGFAAGQLVGAGFEAGAGFDEFGFGGLALGGGGELLVLEVAAGEGDLLFGAGAEVAGLDFSLLAGEAEDVVGFLAEVALAEAQEYPDDEQRHRGPRPKNQQQ